MGSSSKSKRRRQKGGVIITKKSEKNPDEFMSRVEAFVFFINRSTVSLLTSETRGGVLFILKLQPEYTSPYATNRSNAPNSEVRELIIKFAFLNEDGYGYRMSDIISLNPTSASSFMEEIDLQLKVFNASLNEETPISALEPICPSIVIGCILDNSLLSVSKIIKAMLRNTVREDRLGTLILQTILNELDCSPKCNLIRWIISSPVDKVKKTIHFKIGLIAMENLSSFMTVREAKNMFSQQTAIKAMVIFELWRLHNLGYLHGDAHAGNFMIDPTYRYFNGRPGRVVVIDFGSVYRHTFGLLDKTQMAIVSERSQTNKHGHPAPGGWMKISPKNNAQYNMLLLQMHADREIEKQLFLRHVLESVAPEEEKEEEQQQLIIGGGPMSEEINDFDLLDPSHIFTPTFISSYVEQEQLNSARVNDLASGWTKQRINKAKSKKANQRDVKL